jgi:colanic acid biosynthesis glycosyl transferase WcaI
MKILIVNRFFGGAQIPTGRMAEDVARVLAESGHDVTALASSGAYEGAAQARDQEAPAQHGACSMEQGGNAQARDEQSKGLTDQETKRLRDEERIGGRRSETGSLRSGTLRVETVPIPKWMPRALAWLWFTWQARKRIPRMDWDVCVLMTDPPLLPLLAPRAARPKNEKTERRVDVWLMDLYPEALAASGRLSAGNPFYRWYFNRRQRALGASDLLICLGHAQKELLGAGRVERRAWSVEQNAESGEQRAKSESLVEWVRTAVVPPWDDRGNIALATEESLRNLALYAGNLGEAHCFEEILAAVPFLPADWTLRFAARGAKFAGLKAAASELKSRSEAQTARGAAEGKPRDQETKRPGAVVEVTGYASEEETPKLLASARVHLITMSPGWEGIVVPSKLYGCIRTGRPVLFIGPENADTAREIRRNDWGSVLPCGASGGDVAAAILALAARPTKTPTEQCGAQQVAELLREQATDRHG